MSDDLAYVQMSVSAHMEKIVKHFKRGAKIAVLVRSPGFPDRDFMMTDDTIPELRAMLDRRAMQGPPCGECHGSPGEVCDICGRRWPDQTDPATVGSTGVSADE